MRTWRWPTDRAGRGTNAIASDGVAGRWSPSGSTSASDSLALHRAEAVREGLPLAQRCIARIAHDLDTGEDWAILSGETQRLLLDPSQIHRTIKHSPSRPESGRHPGARMTEQPGPVRDFPNDTMHILPVDGIPEVVAGDPLSA